MPHPSCHALSDADRDLLRRFESGDLDPSEFHHREHVRLAYAYLVLEPADRAPARLRSALKGYLDRHGVDPAKYHETITRSWVLAVNHFMGRSDSCASFDDFIAANPRLLDTDIMQTHYSKEILGSQEARTRFVEPDLDPIPRSE